MKYIFFSILTAFILSGCQSKPAPTLKKVQLNCYMRFDASVRKIKAEASFRDAETQQLMANPGGIRFQSTDMPLLAVRGLTYALDFDAAFIASPSFEWKGADKQPLSFAFKAPVIDSFAFDALPLSLKKATRLQWKGTGLSKGESLVLMWDNETSGQTVPMEVTTSQSNPFIDIPAAKLSELGAGNWSLYLVRKRLSKGEVGNYAIECIAEYYSQAQQIRINP